MRLRAAALLACVCTAAALAPAAGLVSRYGGADPAVVAVAGPYGLELRTARTCAAGETLVALPRSAQLSAHLEADLDASARRLRAATPADVWSCRLGVSVLVELLRGPSSPFAEYVDSLPRAYSVPMFWTAPEVAALDYPPLVTQVQKRGRLLAKLGTEGYSVAAAPVDTSSLGWAMAASSSRAFRLGPSETPTLLPLIDMCNHAAAPSAVVVPAKDGAVVLKVGAAPLPEGAEVSLSYGALSNDDLLLDYGFILDDNPNDTVQIAAGADLIDAACAVAGLATLESALGEGPWRAEYLARFGFGQAQGGKAGFGTAVSISARGVDVGLLCALRAVFAPSEAEAARCAGPAAPPLADASAETKALRTAAACCAIALSRFSGSVEDDEDVVLTQELTPAMLMAVRFRLAKKRVLAAAIARVGAAIEAVASGNAPPAIAVAAATSDDRPNRAAARRLAKATKEVVVKKKGKGPASGSGGGFGR